MSFRGISREIPRARNGTLHTRAIPLAGAGFPAEKSPAQETRTTEREQYIKTDFLYLSNRRYATPPRVIREAIHLPATETARCILAPAHSPERPFPLPGDCYLADAPRNDGTVLAYASKIKTTLA